ncbi:putative glyoxalase I [Toxoplasma gondii TgCatPRC2]|uniref:Lactoylglutathione lyase n=10 Tax=Toxoplasma gondii TaxID=5811 RepID=B6KH64_TOXGV|nr:glyoxalase I, putative [Toxoplasma gondii ME49]ESS34288.1 putative glyoxalase I [Toxoplasma gondii VEG]KFG46566.1 putative glyoxalase I [Toxoplasma gondii GAB2-2007-GAL-DOM2]KFG48366.1 putative glyoxalase I [Toxoplasma gondii p89]KFG54089.1 putative glyoxalase I [Toxoplasma gondii FOU]KFG64420.1 putative glyoxalase I [Toxoplasma gondii RUB]KFH12202.1 putative glyoxalase I [Toxoplasma gondii VAND]KYF49697.1 putative glyoxalase I [Toxoplasma gondii ARI]KYK68187.1 putative glyoxalase I [Tox|eukprot:XP_018634997.1 glyoxalase I, putative [Toxoplasma gondii ME49]
MSRSLPTSSDGSIGLKYGFWWQQTMLRIKDPAASLPFYEKNFGMKCIHSYHFPENKFSLYFLERPHDSEHVPSGNGEESERYLWSMKGTCLELTHNHGTENDPSFHVNHGNVEPHRGFGHIAFNTENVQAACEKLEQNGVKFQKRPEEGKMRNIAFVLDPDGYWIELVSRAPHSPLREEYNLSQTMIRIKDPSESLPFYTGKLGMRLVRESHFDDFSLYFLACISPDVELPDPKSDEARIYVKNMWQPVLELTHNHGTEQDPGFRYHNGNDKPQGYGHIGFLCDDLEGACKELNAAGVAFRKKPEEGSMRGLAFIYDPDGYSIELIQRGVSFLSKK